jgi:hypothetical protein
MAKTKTGYITKAYSQKQLLALARKLTEAMLGPERRRLQSEMHRRGQAITGFTGALAGELGDIAPNVQAGYQGAAKDTAAFSKGFSDGLAQLQQGTAQENNEFLGMIGAPAGQMQAPGSALADVLYGTSGAIPGASLEREGAAFGAAASMLPAQAAGRGQQELVRSQYDYNAQLAELAKRRPELMRQILQELFQTELSKQGLAINAGYLGNAQAQTAIDAFNAQAGAAADKREAREARAKSKGEKGKAKSALWDKMHDKTLTLAFKLGDGREVPNPAYDPISDPRETIVQAYSYPDAFNRLWNAYGVPLTKKGFSRTNVRNMIRNSLLAAGFRVPSPGDT